MKRCSTMVLKVAVVFIGIAILVFCGVITWLSFTGPNPIYTLPALGYLCTIPILTALYQTMKLLNYIDKGRAFSTLSVVSLTIITRCAIAVFIVCVIGGLPFLYYEAKVEEAPGLVLIGVILAGMALVAAVFISEDF